MRRRVCVSAILSLCCGVAECRRRRGRPHRRPAPRRWGTHERVIGRVHFAIDPRLPANRGIADLDHAPRNAAGKVEFSSDVLFFRPKDARRARGTVFVEVVNRGRDQSLAILSGAQQRDLSPESWNLGDGFLLEQGFAVAFLGWQFDVQPVARPHVHGADRAGRRSGACQPHRARAARAASDIALTYCASEIRPGPARRSPSARGWTRRRGRCRATPGSLSSDGCSVRLTSVVGTGIYEAVYRAKGSPVAGLGLAAIRDFASYLKHGGPTQAPTLRETAGRAAAGHRLRLLAERPLPARVRSRRLQRRRARPRRVRRADDLVGRRRRRQLQSPLRDAGSGRQLGALGAASGRPAAVHRRRTARQGARPRGSRRRSSTRSRPPSTGRAPDRSRTRPTTAAPTRRWPRPRGCTSWRAHLIRWAGCR